MNLFRGLQIKKDLTIYDLNMRGDVVEGNTIVREWINFGVSIKEINGICILKIDIFKLQKINNYH